MASMRGSAQHTDENIYFRRGHFENRLKELKNDLCMDRTSCSAFLANQLRFAMATAPLPCFKKSDGARLSSHPPTSRECVSS